MRFKFSYKETIVTILAENEDFYEVAVEAILEARSSIERYIKLNPDFLISYEPIDCPGGDEIVAEMCRAAEIAGVGPMASVAGTVAAHAVKRMVERGAKFAVVDNGGDIALSTDRPITIGIYPTRLALRIEPKDFYAVCTSSGKIGHSVSFGYADAVTILADNASVADALATALCNRIGEDFGKEELENTVSEFYESYKKHLDGIIVVKDELIAFAGRIPKILEAEIDLDLITRG